MRLGRVTSVAPLRVELNGDTADAPASGPVGLAVGAEVGVTSVEGRRLVVHSPGAVLGGSVALPPSGAGDVGTSTVSSLDAALRSGWYEVPPGTTGAPDTTSWWLVYVIAHSDLTKAYARQVAHRMTGGDAIFTRQIAYAAGADFSAANWGQWRQLMAETTDTGWYLLDGRYQNGWTTHSNSPGFRKLSSGMVKMQGAVQGGSAHPAAIFNLPGGYRPAVEQRVPVLTDGGLGWVGVFADGNVTHVSGSNAMVDLSPVTFFAEQ